MQMLQAAFDAAWESWKDECDNTSLNSHLAHAPRSEAEALVLGALVFALNDEGFGAWVRASWPEAFMQLAYVFERMNDPTVFQVEGLIRAAMHAAEHPEALATLDGLYVPFREGFEAACENYFRTTHVEHPTNRPRT